MSAFIFNFLGGPKKGAELCYVGVYCCQVLIFSADTGQQYISSWHFVLQALIDKYLKYFQNGSLLYYLGNS